MKYDDLEDVNKEFNAYEYRADPFGTDDWTPIDLTNFVNDCDGFATAKAEKLVKMGWPKSALRLAVCGVKNPRGDHLVLLADFEGKTWVLDNNYPYPMEYQLLPYKWIEFIHLDTGRSELA